MVTELWGREGPRLDIVVGRDVMERGLETRKVFWMKYDHVCDLTLYFVLSLSLWVFPVCYIDVDLRRYQVLWHTKKPLDRELVAASQVGAVTAVNPVTCDRPSLIFTTKCKRHPHVISALRPPFQPFNAS